MCNYRSVDVPAQGGTPPMTGFCRSKDQSCNAILQKHHRISHRNNSVLGVLFQCSESCAFGYQQKITYCVGIHSVQSRHIHGLRTVAYRECPVEPSPYIYKCNVKGCSQAATWTVGKWTKVSTDVLAQFL